jgi:2-amino-4-hydroxy-6-hydroxymethyldihydropteridine diphosphokinase
MHSVILILGSNIEPEVNIVKALKELASRFSIERVSNLIETKSEGSRGPDFLNLAIKIRTDYSLDDLKYQKLRCIEDDLGRVRTFDKNAPRTIDIDIMIFDGQIVDQDIWEHIYLAVPLSEIEPQIVDPQSGQDILTIAKQLKKRAFWRARPDIPVTLI